MGSYGSSRLESRINRWRTILTVRRVPCVANTRDEAGTDRLSFAHMQRAFTKIDNPIVAELSEMGSSVNTIAWTMELVPSIRPFALGSTYLSATLTLIANLSSTKLHPAMRLFGYDIPEYWLTWEIDPGFASRGGKLWLFVYCRGLS
jgi:hypothetical protein